MLQEQPVLTVHDRGDDSGLDAGEQQTVPVARVRTPLRPSTHRRLDRSPAGGAEPLPGVPYAQSHRGRGLSGLAGVGVRGEPAQIHPVEPFHGLFQHVQSVRRDRTGSIAVGIKRRVGAERRRRNRRGRAGDRHPSDVECHHMLVAQRAIRSQEYRHHFGVNGQGGARVRARQRAQPHVRGGIVDGIALTARHSQQAAPHQDDLGDGVGEQRVEQVRISAPGDLIIDVALRQRQERQRLGQCQW